MPFVNKITRTDGSVTYQSDTYLEVADVNAEMAVSRYAGSVRLFPSVRNAEAAAKRMRRSSGIASVEPTPVVVTLV